MIPHDPWPQIGCLIEPLGGAGAASPDRALRRALVLLRRRMAVLFAVSALAGCAQGTTGQAGTPDWPSSPEHQNRNAPERGGGDGGGGGGSM
jgi:hypothetical protein